MLRPALAALLALFVAGPARPAPPPDARALLQQVGDTYRGLTTYHYEGEIALKIDGGGVDTIMHVPLTAAADRDGRMRVNVQHPQMGGLLVADGKRSTMYLYLYNQYQQKPAEATVDSAGRLKSPPNSPLVRYFAPLQGLTGAEVTGEQSVEVGGEAHDCWIVACGMKPPPAVAADTSATAAIVFWVDKARSLVLRDSSRVSLRNPVTGANITSRQVSSYTLASVNGALPDSLFVFRPPEGAKLVKAFGPQAEPETPSELVGKPAPPFTLKGIKGSTVSLAAYKGRVVLLDFWATWCQPCRIEMPRIEKLYKEYKAKGLVVFGVNYAEDAATVRNFLAKNAYTFPILLDTKAEVAGRYGAESIPTVAVIGRDGKVSSYFVGLRDEDVLREALAKAGLK